MRRTELAAFAMLMSAIPSIGGAQGRPDPVVMMAAQREAMVPLAGMDGVWRGPAWTVVESGEKHTITLTERIGPFLDGSVKVIEGRGYGADGKVSFNVRIGNTDWPAAGAIPLK